MTEITAKPRQAVSKKDNKALRAEGQMPAVMYGKKQEATPIALDVREFQKAYAEAGESTVVTLKGLGTDTDVLIHEVDIDPVLGHPRHVDLYVVDNTVAVEVSVPIEFVGEAPAERQLGGTLIKVLHELEVEALPKDLPHEVTVDISSLKTFADQIHVSDVVMPAGVTCKTDLEEVVALVQEAVEEDLSAAAEGPDMEAIAVEEKGKAEEPAEE